MTYTPPVVIDARLKPGFPDELFCAPDVAATVTRRWNEYFPAGVEMGDSDQGSPGPELAPASHATSSKVCTTS